VVVCGVFGEWLVVLWCCLVVVSGCLMASSWLFRGCLVVVLWFIVSLLAVVC